MHGRSRCRGCFVGGRRALLQGTFLKPRHVEGIKSHFCVRGVLFWNCLVGSGVFFVFFFCVVPFLYLNMTRVASE